MELLLLIVLVLVVAAMFSAFGGFDRVTTVRRSRPRIVEEIVYEDRPQVVEEVVEEPSAPRARRRVVEY